jgi:hypothetical protein
MNCSEGALGWTRSVLRAAAVVQFAQKHGFKTPLFALWATEG